VTSVLVALGAALACGLEMLEAVAIVLAVALTRRPREAIAGAVAAVAACVVAGIVAGPLLVQQAALRPVQIVVGVALLAFGGNWLRKAVLRFAGRKARSDSYADFVAERETLEHESPPPADRWDWPGATIAFQGVALEGIEVILIVTALAAEPGHRTAAYAGAAIAAVGVAVLGVVLHRPLRRVPETELKYVVGLLLASYGAFLLGEGLGIDWPLGDAAILVLAGFWLIVTQVLVAVWSRGVAGRTAAGEMPAPSDHRTVKKL
jgi:Ca2+/H+ antiporter, TMEM165/GDT1 family